MKKFTTIIALTLCLAVLLAGCGKTESTKFDYSSAFDDNGNWKNIVAKDYVALCDYASCKVTEEDIDAQIASFQASFPDQYQVTDRAAENGDSVNIDYTGFIDGVAFEGGDTQGNGTTVVIGYTSYIDDFLDQIIGHMPGDSFDVNVTFPENYGVENLNGKDAVFKTRLNYIIEYDMPEVTDEFVQKNLYKTFGWMTVDEMRAGIATNIVMDYAYNNSTISSVPESISQYFIDKTNYEVELYCSAYEQYAKENNFEFAMVLYYFTGYQTKEDYLNAMLEQAAKQANYFTLYQAMIDDMGLTVDEREVFTSYASVENPSASYEEMQKTYGMPYLKAQVLVDKLTKAVGESARQ